MWHQDWLSQSVHWCVCFYTAALSIVFFLGLCQWQFRDDRVLTSNFHCFGALGVGPGAWARTRQAWRMEWKNHKSALPFIFLDLSKKFENNGPQWGFFNSHPPKLLCVCKVWPVVKCQWTQLNWLSTEKWHSVHCFQSLWHFPLLFSTLEQRPSHWHFFKTWTRKSISLFFINHKNM